MNKKGTIFIVEDNLVNMKLIMDLLEFHNYSIIEAYNGKEAMEKIEVHKHEIDLVLMDLQLPEIDGLDLIKAFKNDSSTKHIPIIVISAHVMEADMHKAMEAGCCNYITKPINVEEFVSKIDEFFSEARV
ncbi:MAG: response regulator [Cyanobacteriota bacterium]